MFTGLIQDIGTVQEIHEDADRRLVIATGLDLTAIKIGASIACSGCCLTAVEIMNDAFAVEVSQETLSKTTLANWEAGTKINLEPSLRVGDELGGHLVSGHVDGIVRIENIEKFGNSHKLTISLPEALAPFVAMKGSVALDGISLTVNDVTTDKFTVNIIPHSWSHTTLGFKVPGDELNIEIDMLARYVARINEVKS